MKSREVILPGGADFKSPEELHSFKEKYTQEIEAHLREVRERIDEWEEQLQDSKANDDFWGEQSETTRKIEETIHTLQKLEGDFLMLRDKLDADEVAIGELEWELKRLLLEMPAQKI